ncbi:hypothetical protein [Nonomuraea sp. NEAU-A123]|uniref:hypothetical protein n=1 Tax=Nonomuraea sp. NEAU-A123 TaxID=2839649 RepID=UPI001BE4715D|nr:hypothetical protein [Nonomuraea sp. NEAU-A123]MBT2224848.1 hypothetical protein [Nonomuraea sp. NEAU-A123]
MDPVVLAALTAVGMVLICAIAAMVMVWLTVSRANSADLPAVLNGVATVIRAILGKK